MNPVGEEQEEVEAPDFVFAAKRCGHSRGKSRVSKSEHQIM
jgi:hypothetical protein